MCIHGATSSLSSSFVKITASNNGFVLDKKSDLDQVLKHHDDDSCKSTTTQHVK
jgi:hypothetical protein